MKIVVSVLSLAAMVSPTMAASLSSYSVSTHYTLSETSEASGVTYNWDTGTLFVIGDEGHGVEQYSTSGEFIDRMNLDTAGERAARAVDDGEGIGYLGNGKFAIADERDMMARVTTYEAGVTRTLSQLTPTSYSFGTSGPNMGIEGIAFDPINNSMWAVQEMGPIAVKTMPVGGGAFAEPFSTRTITHFDVASLSDIYVMAACGNFSPDDPRYMNLLLLARDQREILEITRTGTVVDRLDISFLGLGTIEGMTMDDRGTIFLVAEGGTNASSHMFALSAVPEPSTYALIGIASLGAVLRCVRKRKLA